MNKEELEAWKLDRKAEAYEGFVKGEYGEGWYKTLLEKIDMIQ